MAAPLDPIGGVVPKAGGGVRVGLPPRAKFGTPGTRSARPVAKPKPKGPPPRRASSPRGGHHAPAPRPPTASREPDINEMTPAQRHSFATRTVRQNTQTELEPYKQRGAELGNQELNTSRRYGAYGQAADTLIGQQQGSAETSAKSFLNQVADSTLKAEKGVETTGQNTQAGNAGYLDPQVAQALAAQRAVVAGTGAAQRGAAETTGQAETGYMTNLRAAAAQRVAEGQQGISSKYAGLQGQNMQQENRLLGKVPGQIAAKESELATTAFNQRAVQAKIELEGGKLKVAQTEAGTKRKGVEGNLKLAGSKLELDREKFGSDNEYKKAKLELDGLNGESLRNYRNARAAYTKWSERNKGAKTATPAEGNKWAGEVGKVQVLAKSLIGKNKRTSKLYHDVQNQVAKEAEGKYGTAEVQAAINLAFYGHLVGRDEEAAFSHGLNPEMRPNWFKGKKGK